MHGWQLLEAYIAKMGLQHKGLSAARIAANMGVNTWEVSGWIQEYKRAQNAGLTKMVVHRMPHTRTRNALWIFGERKKDTEEVGKKFVSDIACNFVRDIEPTLLQLGIKAPVVKTFADAIASTIDAHVKLLAASL